MVLKKNKWILFSAVLLTGLEATAESFNESSCIRFCNEPMPIYERKVLRYFESALLHTGSMPMQQIKPRAERFFAVIDPILKQYQLPSDFKYLCVVESALNAKAMSHKGAYGYWQFMPHTARAMGLVVDDQKDERENLVKSTHAACRYFLDLYKDLGSWSMVAAAYNAGPSKVKQYLEKHGKVSYYNLRISRENQQYLYRVLAAKELLTRPHLYAAVITEEMGLPRFIGKYGLSLGLIPAPKIKASRKKAWVATLSESTLDQALVTGFNDLIPLSFKRGELLKFMPDIASDVELEFAQNSDDEQWLVWWRSSLPLDRRRRNDLKSLLAESRNSISREKPFRTA